MPKAMASMWMKLLGTCDGSGYSVARVYKVPFSSACFLADVYLLVAIVEKLSLPDGEEVEAALSSNEGWICLTTDSGKIVIGCCTVLESIYNGT
jgi:hypothetical protein